MQHSDLLIYSLNVIWQNIDENGGRILVGICLFITMAPSVVNVYDLRTPEAWIRPWISKRYTQIVPDWWTTLYPITYYYIGAYLKRYVNIKKYNTKKLSYVFLATVLLFGIYNIWRCYSINFIKGIWCHGWGSFQNTTMSVMAFLAINSIDSSVEKRLERHSAKIQFISHLTFGGYLLSWIPDTIFYPQLIEAEPDMILRINYFPVIIPAVILSSLILAYLGELIVTFLQHLHTYLHQRGKAIYEKH